MRFLDKPARSPVGALVQAMRALDPRSRGEDLWRYTQSGSSRARRSCRLCGRNTTWCSKWPRTKTSFREERADVARHADQLVEYGVGGTLKLYLNEKAEPFEAHLRID